ncbi:MAG TPA: hypothetical protein PLX26_12800 [Candidatus Competibacteraceae bacterium]|nr:hypothetical protein [Candidatus Competibacteraceae bacterium]
MKKYWLFMALILMLPTWPATAAIPATSVMTLYRFNGPLEIPYYDVESFRRSGPSLPAGYLTQGSSVIPCLVIRDGTPLTDRNGTPYVGFRVVVDARTATPAATERFEAVMRQRQAAAVANHHCGPGVRHLLNVRHLYDMEKAPFFDPPPPSMSSAIHSTSRGGLDRIVRAFHNSPQCQAANRQLVGRRNALQSAWNQFIRSVQAQWSEAVLQQAKHLDYVMRTAIFEGHLDRGCNAYGSCERNIIALSIRNRGREGCSRHWGCRYAGDYQGVASQVSQYNIWDEYLTQVSGLTACFLRDDLGGPSRPGAGYNAEYYRRLQGMYAQNLDAVQRILFGNEQDLRQIFPNTSVAELKSLRHYYHAPAMGKCFPHHDRVEYISGAVARQGGNFALIANTRIQVGQPTLGGYYFRDFLLRQDEERDVTRIVDLYPGFVIDGRKVSLRTASHCVPYGIPQGCRFNSVGRYRKTPSWLSAGRPLAVSCRVHDRGAQCQGGGGVGTVTVGGACDTQMRPVAGVR